MTERKAAVIGREARVRGRVAGDEDLLVFGRIEGEVDLRGALRVELGGVVRARIRATAVRVAGVVVGEVVVADLLHLCSTARVVGDLRAARVVMEPGAQVAGAVVVEGEAREAEGPRRSFAEPSRARIQPQPLEATPSRSPRSPAGTPEPDDASTPRAARDVPGVVEAASPVEAALPAPPAPVIPEADVRPPSPTLRPAELRTHFVPPPAASAVAQALTEHRAWERDEGAASSVHDVGPGRVHVRPRGDRRPPLPPDERAERPTLMAPPPERPTSLEPAPERRVSYRPQPEASLPGTTGRASLPVERPTELGGTTGRPTIEARGRPQVDMEAGEPAGRPTVLAAQLGAPELGARALRTSVPSPSRNVASARARESATHLEPAPPGTRLEPWGEATRIEPAPEDSRTTLAARPGPALPLVEAVPSSTPPRGGSPSAAGRAPGPAVPAPRELRGTELPSQLPHPSMVAPSAVEPARRRVLVRLRRRGDED